MELGNVLLLNLNMINLENMRPGICPFCGSKMLMSYIVWLELNDGSKMAQPVCAADQPKLQTEAGKKEIIEACKGVWVKEIMESVQRTEEQKQIEIERIMKIDIKAGEK